MDKERQQKAQDSSLGSPNSKIERLSQSNSQVFKSSKTQQEIEESQEGIVPMRKVIGQNFHVDEKMKTEEQKIESGNSPLQESSNQYNQSEGHFERATAIG